MDRVVNHSECFQMGARLGGLSVVRVERNFASKNTRNINWPASNKQRADLIKEGKTPYSKTDAPDGIKWFVFLNEHDYYLRFHWNKYEAQVVNKSVYRFEATRGRTGNRTLLKNRIEEQGNIALFSFPLIQPRTK